jgi:hypothetical protein
MLLCMTIPVLTSGRLREPLTGVSHAVVSFGGAHSESFTTQIQSRQGCLRILFVSYAGAAARCRERRGQPHVHSLP